MKLKISVLNIRCRFGTTRRCWNDNLLAETLPANAQPFRPHHNEWRAQPRQSEVPGVGYTLLFATIEMGVVGIVAKRSIKGRSG